MASETPDDASLHPDELRTAPHPSAAALEIAAVRADTPAREPPTLVQRACDCATQGNARGTLHLLQQHQSQERCEGQWGRDLATVCVRALAHHRFEVYRSVLYSGLPGIGQEPWGTQLQRHLPCIMRSIRSAPFGAHNALLETLHATVQAAVDHNMSLRVCNTIIAAAMHQGWAHCVDEATLWKSATMTSVAQCSADADGAVEGSMQDLAECIKALSSHSEDCALRVHDAMHKWCLNSTLSSATRMKQLVPGAHMHQSHSTHEHSLDSREDAALGHRPQHSFLLPGDLKRAAHKALQAAASAGQEHMVAALLHWDGVMGIFTAFDISVAVIRACTAQECDTVVVLLIAAGTRRLKVLETVLTLELMATKAAPLKVLLQVLASMHVEKHNPAFLKVYLAGVHQAFSRGSAECRAALLEQGLLWWSTDAVFLCSVVQAYVGAAVEVQCIHEVLSHLSAMCAEPHIQGHMVRYILQAAAAGHGAFLELVHGAVGPDALRTAALHFTPSNSTGAPSNFLAAVLHSVLHGQMKACNPAQTLARFASAAAASDLDVAGALQWSCGTAEHASVFQLLLCVVLQSGRDLSSVMVDFSMHPSAVQQFAHCLLHAPEALRHAHPALVEHLLNVPPHSPQGSALDCAAQAQGNALRKLSALRSRAERLRMGPHAVNECLLGMMDVMDTLMETLEHAHDFAQDSDAEEPTAVQLCTSVDQLLAAVQACIEQGGDVKNLLNAHCTVHSAVCTVESPVVCEEQ